MQLTSKHRSKIRKLSDTELYHEAMTFAGEHSPIANSQMTGLLEYSRSWAEINDFVAHQLKRDWGEPGKSKRAHYREFYAALHKWLESLRRKLKDDYGFIPDDLTKKETRSLTGLFGGLLAREFIQHLATEMMYLNTKEAK